MAKMSISFFKLKRGSFLGCKTVLRGKNILFFFENLFMPDFFYKSNFFRKFCLKKDFSLGFLNFLIFPQASFFCGFENFKFYGFNFTVNFSDFFFVKIFKSQFFWSSFFAVIS